MKKPTRKQLVKKADTEFSLYIRARDGVCYCGANKADPLQCCHLFSRTNHATRWDEDYAFAGHSGCNLEHEYHPEKMTLWFINKFGKDAYEKGVWKHNSVAKFSNFDLEQIADLFKKKREALNGHGTDKP